MERNIVFSFSGTGNSLKAAKDIAGSLDNCNIVSMGKSYRLSGAYERIGFVFPSYAMGLPGIVEEFIKSLDLSENKGSYYFTVVTCGQSAGNSIYRIAELLKAKGATLQFGSQLLSFSNYVVLYPMADNADEKAKEAEKALNPMITEIVGKRPHVVPRRSNPALTLVHNFFITTLPKKDEGFHISDNCDRCGVCTMVCPVNNIKMKDQKPLFQHQCQQCMACIQWCPNRAIEYKNKTQNRGRYRHPDISCAEMIEQAEGKR